MIVLKSTLFCLILCIIHGASQARAQSVRHTTQDSVRSSQADEAELNIDPRLWLELQRAMEGEPQISTDKPWMDFDYTLPTVPEPSTDVAPRDTIRLTLHPYTCNTPFDWDPVYQRKIKVDKDTWKGPFYKIHKQQTEAPVTAGAGGYDLMAPFTKEFWQFRRKKNRRETLRVLKSYSVGKD